MNNDIIASENPVVRRGRPPNRVEVKQAPVQDSAAEPQRQSKRGPRPGSVNGVMADRLAVPDAIKRAYPDCMFYWENDEKGQVQIRESRGWEVVKGSFVDGAWSPGQNGSGNVYSIPVGQGETKSDIQAVLMALPVEWYEDDLRSQEEQNRQTMNSLRRGSNPNEVNSDGSYAPRLANGKVGLSVEQGTR